MSVSVIFTYPTAEELKVIEPEKLDVLTMDDPLFTLMPMVSKDTHVVSWEQRDNFIGMQGVRGLNGQPSRVRRIGGKRFTMEPGVYGEYTNIDEQEMTTRRQWGSEAQVIDITDLVLEAQDQLLQRRIDRIRFIGWTLLTKGWFSVSDETGVLTHTDAYPVQTFVAAVTWATVATATPLANFRAIKLLGRGRSTSFGSNSVAYMNQGTFNSMVANTNSADIAGRRTIGLNALVALNRDEINRVLLGEDLPQIAIYDEGYYDDNATFNLFIPNNVVVLVGTRPGSAPVMEYIMTRNVNNPGEAPGAYTKVVDNPDIVPREIKVHDGHNGGPAMYYPGSVVIMQV